MKKNTKKKNTVAVNTICATSGNEPITSYEKTFLQMNKLPLYAYLANILEHHFKMFEEMIAAEFDQKYKGLF